MYPCLICGRQFPTSHGAAMHMSKGHEEFHDLWIGAGPMITEMHEKGEFTGREREMHEMVRALNDWWKGQNSDPPERFTDYKWTEFDLIRSLREMSQKAFMAGFFEGFKRGVEMAPRMEKNLENETKEMLDRPPRAPG